MIRPKAARLRLDRGDTVARLIADVYAGRIHPRIAAGLAPLLNLQMRAIETTDPERRLTESNRPVEDWGKLLGDAAAVSAMLDRLLHHGHVLKCGPRSWRTKTDLPPQEAAG
jgi:hypothetical protein